MPATIACSYRVVYHNVPILGHTTTPLIYTLPTGHTTVQYHTTYNSFTTIHTANGPYHSPVPNYLQLIYDYTHYQLARGAQLLLSTVLSLSIA